MTRKSVIAAAVILTALFTACQVNSPVEEMYEDDPGLFSYGDIIKSTLESEDENSRSLVPTLHNFLARNCTLTVTGTPGVVPFAGTYSGYRDSLKFFLDYNKAIRIQDIRIQETLAEGNQETIHMVIKGKVKPTGNTFSIEYIFALVMDGNRISAITVYYDTYVFHKAFNEGTGQFYSDLRNPTRPVYNPKDPTDYRPLVETGLNDFYVNRDIPAFLSKLHPEIYWIFKGDEDLVPYVGVYSGVSGVLNFMMNTAPNGVALSTEFTGSVQQGNRLDYFFTEHLYAVPTGEEAMLTGVFSILVEDNSVLEFKPYHDTYAVSEAFQPD